MNNIPLPRFRGRAFEKDDGWSWEVFINFLGDNDNGMVINANLIFTSREDAITDMKKAIKMGCDIIQKEVMGEVTGNYIDMKTNETLNWDKKGYN